MLTIYGSKQCPDCVACREELDRAGVRYEYKELTDQLLNLKEFLALRDHEHVFEQVRAEGMIGIPCIVRTDGSVTLDWAEFTSM